MALPQATVRTRTPMPTRMPRAVRAALALLAATTLALATAACGSSSGGGAAETSSPFDISEGDLELGGQATYYAATGTVLVATTGQRSTRWERVTDDGSEWRTAGGDTIRLGTSPSPTPGEPVSNATLTAATAPGALAALGVQRATTAPPRGGRVTGTGAVGNTVGQYALVGPTAGLGAKEGAPVPATELGWVVVVPAVNSTLDVGVLLGTLEYQPN